jgi:hypothetical protein
VIIREIRVSVFSSLELRSLLASSAPPPEWTTNQSIWKKARSHVALSKVCSQLSAFCSAELCRVAKTKAGDSFQDSPEKQGKDLASRQCVV